MTFKRLTAIALLLFGASATFGRDATLSQQQQQPSVSFSDDLYLMTQ